MNKNPKMANDKMADKFGFTALHIAASNDFVEVANVLIKKVSNMLIRLKNESNFPNGFD